MRVSQETRDALEGARTEMGANRTLRPKDDYNRGFNEGIGIAIGFINSYLAGRGLFQTPAPDRAAGSGEKGR